MAETFVDPNGVKVIWDKMNEQFYTEDQLKALIAEEISKLVEGA